VEHIVSIFWAKEEVYRFLEYVFEETPLPIATGFHSYVCVLVM